jgi:hypothetical protein
VGLDLAVPVPIVGGIGVGLNPAFDPAPGPVPLPPGEPVVTRLRRPLPLRDFMPLRAVVDPPQDAVDHLPVITPVVDDPSSKVTGRPIVSTMSRTSPNGVASSVSVRSRVLAVIDVSGCAVRDRPARRRPRRSTSQR